ncbi:MAG: nucleotide exchange factor GrpE [Gammaproteobacteria bacterium]
MSKKSESKEQENTEAELAETMVLQDGEAGEPSGEAAAELLGVEDLQQALDAAQAQAEENWSKFVRASAELDNVRKRNTRDVENARRFGIENFAAEVLATVDSLEMGLEVGTEASVETLLEGKKATLKQLQAAMEKFGVVEILPAGEPFDPELHEAMSVQPSDTAEPGSVLTVVQKGYLLNGRLLRPARVVVAKAPDSDDD